MDTSMELEDSVISCGVGQLHNLEQIYSLSRFYAVIEDLILHDGRDGGSAFWIFSDRVDEEGDILAKYIRAEKLGELTESPPSINPNTKSEIKVWVWKLPTYDEFIQKKETRLKKKVAK